MIAGFGRESLGVLFSIGSAALYDVGYVLEKQALDRLPEVGLHPLRLLSTVLPSRRWLAGFSTMLAGLGLQVLAFTLAPASVVQPILVGGLASLALVAGPLLGERLRWRQAAALGLVFASVVAIAVSTGGSGVVADRAPLNRFVALAVPIAALAVALAWVGNQRGRIRIVDLSELNEDSAGQYWLVASAFGAGLLYGLSAVAEKAVATRMVADGVVHGAWGALASAYPWLFIVATAMGLVAFQAGLQRYPASMMVTFTNLASAFCALLGASVVFGERLLPAGGWAVARVAGFVAVAAALTLLATDRQGIAAELAT